MTQIWRFLGPWAIPKTKVNAEKHTSISTRIQHFTSTKTLPYLLFTSKIKALIYWYILEHSECRGPSDDFSCGEHSFPSQGKEQFLSPASPILWIQTRTIHREEPYFRQAILIISSCNLTSGMTSHGWEYYKLKPCGNLPWSCWMRLTPDEIWWFQIQAHYGNYCSLLIGLAKNAY